MKNALKSCATAAAGVLLLSTCTKKNDSATPSPAEARITSFKVPNAQTTFRGDTILVRLNSNYSSTSIRPTILFKNASAVSPVSGEMQEFEAKPALNYSLQTAGGSKRYTVVVVPTAPLRINWIETQRVLDRCDGPTRYVKVTLGNVGSITDTQKIRLTVQDALSGKTLEFESFLSTLAHSGVSAEQFATPQLGTYSVAIEYRDALNAVRQAQSQNRLSVRDQTQPKPYNPVPVLTAGSLSGVSACGLSSSESYQLTFKDSLNRTYSAPLRYTSLAVPALFTTPTDLPTGPVEVTLVHDGKAYSFGRTGVIRDRNKPHIQRSLVRIYDADEVYPYVSGAYTTQFKSGQDLILLHGSVDTRIPGATPGTFTGASKSIYIKLSAGGKEISRLYTLGAQLKNEGFSGVRAQIPNDLKGTFQVSLLIQEPDGTFTATDPYWDKIRIE